MSGTQQTPEQIESDIARQRDELAATVAELQYRLDVKSRGREKLVELSHRPPVLAGVALAVVVAGLAVWQARRHH